MGEQITRQAPPREGSINELSSAMGPINELSSTGTGSSPEVGVRMRVEVRILYPFDMGLELDLSGQEAGALVARLANAGSVRVALGGRELGTGQVSGRIYRFGIGVLELSLDLELDFDGCARISCNTALMEVDGQSIADFAESHVHSIIESAQRFATYRYERRLEDRELFPLFIVRDPIAGEAADLIDRHRKALFGIVAGEPDYDRISARVLEREPLENLAYFGNDLILVRRFGAVLSGAEADTSADVLSLVLAQYWSMRSYDHVLDHELSQAQQQLEELPKYYEFWRMPGRYHDFSNEAIDFAKDKITITQSMHTLLGSESQIEADWALRELYEEAGAAFGMEAIVARVETKLTRIESAYNVAREQLSANFYILLDIIFLTFLVWSIIDTLLLARIAFRG